MRYPLKKVWSEASETEKPSALLGESQAACLGFSFALAPGPAAFIKVFSKVELIMNELCAYVFSPLLKGHGQ